MKLNVFWASLAIVIAIMVCYLSAWAIEGDTLWSRSYGNTEDFEITAAHLQTPEGDFLLAGWRESALTFSADMLLVKTDSDGDTLWTRLYGTPWYDQALAMTQTNDGYYLLAGSTALSDTGYSDVYVVKITSSGDTVWTRTYDHAEDDRAQSIIPTSEGNYLLAGSTYYVNPMSTDMLLIVVSCQGVYTQATRWIWQNRSAGHRPLTR